ncbi:TonB-dependent receptor [Roseospira marina]|uniref:TonB-dependent receptor n=1 Tax=Roseospira marina TaxID=140057 RepID=A0A5M6I8U0_9PROT|nr:TonB-dependent receptor [Roseospira marina]KAA5604225.1 TonB-dependent receptor [Roseospira marina]MBB4315630.1 iron complex outermembrane receptor protein [Roseospira marina]MBB5088626.1 iron complex outermembrane receptor protein [Roseospira marina]
MTRPITLFRPPTRCPTACSARALLVPIAGLLTVAPAQAQDTPRAETAAAASPAQAPLVLETVTVTARRAQEDIRDIPFSVTVVGGDEVEARGTTTLENTFASTPGVGLLSYGDTDSANIKIRGVGSLNRVSGDDSSVIVYVDGMPAGVSDISAQTLDVERLELLKGPQGTLYGRNSEAGAINITSRRPTDEREGYIRGEVGTGAYRLTEGAVSGPIVDTLKGRLAFRYTGMDSWVENANTGEPLTEPEDVAVRGTLLWEPTDETSLTVIANHEAMTEHAALTVMRPYGEAPVADVPDGSISDNKWNTRVSAELTHDLPFAVATLFSGYTRNDYYTEGPFYEGRLYDTLIGMSPDGQRRYQMGRDTFNEELRLSSRPEDDIFWVAGANYFRSDRFLDTRDAYDTYYPGNPFNADIDRDFSVESYALFGEITYPLFDVLKVTAGLRHTWEHKTYDAVWRANDTNPSALRTATDSDTLDDDYTTGRLALAYDVTEEATVYGTYARGYKSGGWNDFGSNIAMGQADPAYKAAVVDSYEIGVKSEWLGGDLTVNGAVFWNQTEDDHLFIFDTTTFSTLARNFDTESKGIELDASWRIGHGFTLGGSLAYIDATITKVPATSGSGVSEGNAVPGVPEWGWTLSLTHEQELPDFLVFKDPLLTTSIRNQYVGVRPAAPENTLDLPSYNKLDFRLGLSTVNADVYFRADNLLDERYDTYAYYYPAMMAGGPDGSMGGPSRGRSFVLGASYYF